MRAEAIRRRAYKARITELQVENKELRLKLANEGITPREKEWIDLQLKSKQLRDTMELIMTYMHTLRPESVATRFEWIKDKIQQALKDTKCLKRKP